MIIAYLVRYMEGNNLSAEDIDKLLAVLGLDSLDEMFTVNIAGLEIVGLYSLIDYIKGQLTSGEKLLAELRILMNLVAVVI